MDKPSTTAAGLTSRSVQFSPGAALRRYHKHPRYLYLLQSGVFSDVLTLSDGSRMGTTLSGVGQLLDIPSLLGWPETTARTRALIQGSALQLPYAYLQERLKADAQLEAALYAAIAMRTQELEIMVVCSRFHSLEQRLAKLLLLLQAKLGAPRLEMTQATLAQELGVNRTSLVAAITSLRAKHLVKLTRGSIAVEDAVGLRACACVCYSVLNQMESDAASHREAIQKALLTPDSTSKTSESEGTAGPNPL